MNARNEPNWWTLATSTHVVRMSLLTAAIAAPILIWTNHGEALSAGTIDTLGLLRIGLCFAIPYGLQTILTVSTIRAERKRSRRS